jgi:hypothetical protein
LPADEGDLTLRDIARRFVLTRRLAGTAVAALASLTAFAALGAPTALAASSVTIKTSFENSPVSLNTTDAIGFALTNNTGTAQTVTFTDTLPSGVTLDNPIGTTNTNGTGVCTLTPPTANPGASSVTVTVTVPSETASGSVCTISFSIVASTPSANDVPLKDSYSGVSGSTVTPTTTTGSLIVLSSPTLSFSAPSNGQSFTLGQVFNASFGCTQTDPLDSISAFFGTDDEGNQIQSGAPIDTLDPGTRSLEVDCYSAAGGDITQTISYKVGSYSLTALREAKKTDFVSFKTLVPAGKLVARLLYGVKKTVIGTTRTTVGAHGTVSVTIKPTAAGRKLLAAVRTKTAAATVTVSFTPAPIGTGDTQITAAGATVVSRTVKLPIAHAARAHASRGARGTKSNRR